MKDPAFIVAEEQQDLRVIELRNYLIKRGKRDEFINYFENNFIASQNALGGYILGQYTVKGQDDHFFWMRGFADMSTRFKFLNEFYLGAFWKAHRQVPNSLLLNNDNVCLLKPLNLSDDTSAKVSFGRRWFAAEKGIAVIDFYISNTKLDKLIAFVKTAYSSILRNAGIEKTSFWVSEMSANDFKALPVFQGKNLMVQISFYEDDAAYQTKLQLINSLLTEQQRTEMADLITLQHTLVVYPTKNSYSNPQ